MAYMIPEAINVEASEIEQELFALLRRHLPETYIALHRFSMEVEPEQQVPFLLLQDEIGIAAVMPLHWPDLTPMEAPLLQQQSSSSEVGAVSEYKQELQNLCQRAQNLRQFLVDSELPGLVDAARGLQPTFHTVYVLLGHTARDLNAGLRTITDEGIVLAPEELPQLHDILRQQTPPGRGLSGESFNGVRWAISPDIEISGTHPDPSQTVTLKTLPLMLDPQQEQIVKSYAYIPPDQQSLARDLDARLLRGVVGSGKSLILLHRARFLSQIHPHWRILVVTYTKSLVNFLRSRLRDLPHHADRIDLVHFHGWCYQHLHNAGLWRRTLLKDGSCKGLIANICRTEGISISDLDPGYLLEELNWIRDQDLSSWEAYAEISRRGRKRRLVESQRRQVWELLAAYRRRLRELDQLDWAEVPSLVQQGMDQGQVPTKQYHAVLVDEAQDFAPSWFAVVQKMLIPKTNMLFIASDGAQKIYKNSMSWRAMGIDVTGNRSRILDRSYRNTYEILSTAHRLIGNDPSVQIDLIEEGDGVIQPNLDRVHMRSGPDPLVLPFADTSQELEYVLNEIRDLRQNGCEWQDIGVFHPYHNGLERIANLLRREGIPVHYTGNNQIDVDSPDVKLMTLHSSKGLEFTAVFITGVEQLQPRPGLDADELAAEIARQRRLLYVGMTRARQWLFVTYVGTLPRWATQLASSN